MHSILEVDYGHIYISPTTVHFYHFYSDIFSLYAIRIIAAGNGFVVNYMHITNKNCKFSLTPFSFSLSFLLYDFFLFLLLHLDNFSDDHAVREQKGSKEKKRKKKKTEQYIKYM